MSSDKKDQVRNATGSDNVSVKLLLEALEENGIDEITTLLNKLYAAGQIPPDISKLHLKQCQRNLWEQSMNYIERPVF